MSPLDPDGETAEPSVCVCVGCISVTAPTAWDYQWKIGENIMVHLRVLLQDLDEKHSE